MASVNVCFRSFSSPIPHEICCVVFVYGLTVSFQKQKMHNIATLMLESLSFHKSQKQKSLLAAANVIAQSISCLEAEVF